MARREDDAAAFGVTDGVVVQTTFAGDAEQVNFEQRGDMRRVMDILKMGEALFEQQAEETQQAELVRSGDKNPAARFGEADQLAHESTRVFEVLDGLDGDDDIGAGGWKIDGRV